MRLNTRYLAVLGALVAAMAIACADPTSPKPSSDCSGGGTQGWDHCSGTAIVIDTMLAKTP